MVQCIEYHGRLGRGAPMDPGQYDLLFQLHPNAHQSEVLWEEAHEAVEVDDAGRFRVMLGGQSPLEPEWFRSAPPFLSVHRLRNGHPSEPLTERLPLPGSELRLATELNLVEGQLRLLTSRLRKRLRRLRQRVASLENGGGPVAQLSERIAALDLRLHKVDGEEGRISRLEDELEDVVGSDGDLIDIYERLERLEGGPIRREENTRITEFDKRLSQLEAREPADSLVKKAGDSMSGGLTITKGGLHVTSGGIHGRGAEVNTLEASLQVKTPKLVTEGIELRGDLTVDNTQRTLQIRNLEGRAGGSRKDGVLHLNSRSGAEVVVGRAENSEGLRVHGPLHADVLELPAQGMVELLETDQQLTDGEVVVMGTDGKVRRSTMAEDPSVVGVVRERAGLRSGKGSVPVQTFGIARCKVEGPIAIGDLLSSGMQPGVAHRAHAGGGGTVLGKCLSAPDPTGEALILLGGR